MHPLPDAWDIGHRSPTGARSPHRPTPGRGHALPGARRASRGPPRAPRPLAVAARHHRAANRHARRPNRGRHRGRPGDPPTSKRHTAQEVSVDPVADAPDNVRKQQEPVRPDGPAHERGAAKYRDSAAPDSNDPRTPPPPHLSPGLHGPYETAWTPLVDGEPPSSSSAA